MAFDDKSQALERGAMSSFPPSSDPLVAALQRLIAAHGGYVAVADTAGVNDQYLYQIAYAKPHSKTGTSRSVGPGLRKKLDQAFPGWLDAGSEPPRQAAPAARSNQPNGLNGSLAVVLDAILQAPPARWASIRSQFDQAVANPEMRDDVLAELLALLSSPPTKRLGAAA